MQIEQRYLRKVLRDDSNPERYSKYFGDDLNTGKNRSRTISRSASIITGSIQNGQTVSTRSAAQTFHNTLSDLVNKSSMKGNEVIRELVLSRIAGELSMVYGTDCGETLRMLVPIVKGNDQKNDDD